MISFPENMATDSSSSMDEILALSALIVVRRRRRKRREAQKRMWVRPWLKRRDDYGAYDRLMHELEMEDIPGYVSFQRLHPELFKELLHLVSPIIQKQGTNMRMAIPPAVRLALTMRYLATGPTYISHQFEFRVAANTIGQIIPETCAAIYQVLRSAYLQCPATSDDWRAVAKEFEEKWQFPNCLGAVDGKHVLLRPPAKSGSFFFNYKHTFSIVLMAVVDAEYKFLYVDIGTNGRVSDGGVFAETNLHEAIESGLLKLPAPTPFSADDTLVEYCFVADEAFPLRRYIMKPYPYRQLTAEQRIFNYRLSRARRVVENAFGILANRFRVFLHPMLIGPEKSEHVVLAACALHNTLRERSPHSAQGMVDREDDETHEVTPGTWRRGDCMEEIRSMKGNNATNSAKGQRDYICKHFNSHVGSVSWQDRMVWVV